MVFKRIKKTEEATSQQDRDKAELSEALAFLACKSRGDNKKFLKNEKRRNTFFKNLSEKKIKILDKNRVSNTAE